MIIKEYLCNSSYTVSSHINETHAFSFPSEFICKPELVFNITRHSEQNTFDVN